MMVDEARETDALTTHEYDGIKEYDNPCPGWWTWLFFGTFVFSVVYFVFFGWSRMAWTNDSWYQDEVAADLKRQFSEIGDLTANEETILRYMVQPRWRTVGEVAFKTHCVSCHGANAEGLDGGGPNMTDDHYKNVKTVEDIARVIANGAANGAMPAWKTRLHPNEIVLLSSYIAWLRDQPDIPGPRGPEGDVIPPWPAPPEDAETTESG